ncbi:MAG TPA: DinB family protein [Puia sp.]|jgi:uncharacterized damage-inducible protein DinB|nr:DinB family protein [Puia sp.]
MKLLFCFLLSSAVCSVSAQNSISDTLRQQLLRDWQRAKEYTDEYLNAAPADKYGFRPTDSIRSFAEQMLHLAAANAGLVFIGTGSKYPFATQNFEKSPALQNKDSVWYYVNTSYDFAIHAIQQLDFNKLTEVVSWNLPMGRRSETRLAWLLKAFEHQTHHRGQCTIYLRLMGVKPPAEKLFD